MPGHKKVFLLLLFMGPSLSAFGDTLIGSSGPQSVPLVELYSSESCSSCPPADDWISKLATKPGLWKKFVPVVFHVDYWNNLGWYDQHSSAAMTARQVSVAQTWSLPSVYTPSVVVAGQEHRDWPNLSNFAPGPQHSLWKLEIWKKADGHFRVSLQNMNDPLPENSVEIHLAYLGMDLETNVTGGENAGKKLRHNFVVFDWQKRRITGKLNSVAHQEDFDPPTEKNRPTKMAVVAWIEYNGKPIALQATGGNL